MNILEWTTAILLVVGIGGIGAMKLASQKIAVEAAERLGYESLRIPIGVAEVLAAAGVTIGAASSDLQWLGVLAAAGIIALMLGALIYHRRDGDTKEMAPAAVLIVAAALYILALFGN